MPYKSMTFRKKCTILTLSLVIGWYPILCAWQREEQVYESLDKKERKSFQFLRHFFMNFFSEINTKALLSKNLVAAYGGGGRKHCLENDHHVKSYKLGLARNNSFLVFLFLTKGKFIFLMVLWALFSENIIYSPGFHFTFARNHSHFISQSSKNTRCLWDPLRVPTELISSKWVSRSISLGLWSYKIDDI